MGALLTPLVEQWLGDTHPIEVRDAASVVLVQAEVRRVGAEVGLDQIAVESAANAASELAHNQLVHAHDGFVGVRAVRRAGVAGVEIIAADGGPGIANPTDALRGGRLPPTGRKTGLGVGLSAAIKLVDEVDADVRWGEGTCIGLRKLASPVTRSEVAILGRACAGEHVSGDQTTFVRDERALLVALADGLGHGEPARAASDLAVATLREHAQESPANILAHCDTTLASSRGAVMAVARIDLATRRIDHASAGNIATRIYQRDGGLRALMGSARILGSGQRGGRIAAETVPGQPYQTLIMYSDGISSRFILDDAPEILRLPALAIAHHIVGQFGRDSDDVLVLVAR